MKKTLLLLCLLAGHAAGAQTPTQVTVRDDAKVGLIVTGTGNTINTTQIFGKSPEYAELKKALATLESDIQKKAAVCEKMAKDNLPAEYRDGCRSELIALNARRDSVQKIETRFREDVILLAESFAKMELNSERLRLAKALFEEGKIREADHVLNAREMKQEGDALLAKKEREQKALHETDSLLRVKANEFALKARLKATDYGDSLRYDSAVIYFEQSRKYAETVENLQSFATLLGELNQTPRAIGYLETALKLASESEEASLANSLGVFYSDVQKMSEAEKMYLRSLEIYERLATASPAQFEPGLAKTAMNLGNFYFDVHNKSEAEKMYLRSLEIRERLATGNPAQFESDLAMTAMHLGVFYSEVQNMSEAEKMYLRSLEIHERLAKANPAQFEPDLARTANNLGNFYSKVPNMPEAEKMYLLSLEIRERLATDNPAQFEPDLALTAMNLGNFYYKVKKMPEAEKMYLRSLEICERLAKASPAQFEPDLAKTAMNLGNFYFDVQKMPEAEKMYLRSLEIRERLATGNPAQFEPDLAATAINLGVFYSEVQKMSEAEKMYLRSLEIYGRLATANPAQFEPGLATLAMNLGNFYSDVQKMSEAEKMYLLSLEIRERLAKATPDQFEPYLALTLGNYGMLQVEKRNFSNARQFYGRAHMLFQKFMMRGQTYYQNYFDDVQNAMSTLRDFFHLRKDYASAIAIQGERAASYALLRDVDSSFLKNATLAYDTLAQMNITAGQYLQAAEAAERAIALDSSFNAARLQLGHALILIGARKRAQEVYKKYITAEKDPAAAKAIIVKAWDDFEAQDLACPEILKARAWAKE